MSQVGLAGSRFVHDTTAWRTDEQIVLQSAVCLFSTQKCVEIHNWKYPGNVKRPRMVVVYKTNRFPLRQFPTIILINPPIHAAKFLQAAV